MIISEDIINQIKERINIVDVIGEYVNLKVSGKNYKGLCPFHSEKTPSFTVSPEKGIFHCFGCGAGGNVITFLMKMKGISFPDAVRILGRRSGIQIRSSNFEGSGKSKYETIYKINKIATTIFERNLFSEKGRRALEYLKGRHFDLDTIKSFHLGYAEESWDALFNLLRKKGFNTDLIDESGLIVKNKSGTGYYDRFRNRIIFPIQDNIERVIGFGGRTLDQNNPDIPKYINTNENIVFRKGKYLFGFHNSAEFISKSGSVFLVEGYLDVIRMYKEGIKNTVAPLGTALTEEQVSFIIRYTRKLYLVFDPDEAGRKATLRSITLINRHGLDPAVILLPLGRDPGDFFDEYSAEDFSLLVDGSESGINYIVKYHIDPKKEYTANEKITILQTLCEYYNNMNDEILKTDFVKKISSVLKLTESIIERELTKFIKGEAKAPYKLENEKKVPSKEKKDKWIRAEQYLLLLILSNPHLLSIAVPRLDESDFHGKWTRKLWHVLLHVSENEHWDSGTVFDYLDDERYIEYLSGKLMEEELTINPENQLIDVIASLKEKRILDRISDINTRLMKAELENNESLTNELIIEKQAYRHELEKMKILRGSKTWS